MGLKEVWNGVREGVSRSMEIAPEYLEALEEARAARNVLGLDEDAVVAAYDLKTGNNHQIYPAFVVSPEEAQNVKARLNGQCETTFEEDGRVYFLLRS